MKVRLTLQEKLRDLRDERKLKLQDVSDVTTIPLATVQRIESTEDYRAAYQDLMLLAQFYGVSTDYLFGLTDNRQYRNVEIDALSLSDDAIKVLKNKKLNNRLVSELLSHPDFQQLLSAIEVYIDKKLMPHLKSINDVFKLVETTIKENYTVADNDEIMATLQNSVVEDDFLRFRISERFNEIIKSLFDTHKKDGLPLEQFPIADYMKEQLQAYLANQKMIPPEEAKAKTLCELWQLNTAKLTDEEWHVLVKICERSAPNTKGIRKQ